MEQRTFYKHAMKTGVQLQLYIPKDIALALDIRARDELEITMKKTGRVIERKRVASTVWGKPKQAEPVPET